MGIGSTQHRTPWWPGLNSQRMSLVTLAINRMRLRSKLQSLNHQFRFLFLPLQHEGQSNTSQDAQEAYWYETACLIEESRKLKLSYPTPIAPETSSSNCGKSIPVLGNRSLYTQIVKTTLGKPPTITPIVILFILHGISIGAGVLWLLGLA